MWQLMVEPRQGPLPAWPSFPLGEAAGSGRAEHTAPALVDGPLRVVGGALEQHPHQHWRSRGRWRKQKVAERSTTAADVIAPSGTGLDDVNCEKFCCAQEEDVDTCIAVTSACQRKDCCSSRMPNILATRTRGGQHN